MKNNIINLPKIPYEDIADKSRYYRVYFNATELQMDEIFSKYEVLLRHEPVSTLDEIITILKPFRPSGLELEGVSELLMVIGLQAIDEHSLSVENASYWVLYGNQLLIPHYSKPQLPCWFSLAGETSYMSGKNQYFQFNQAAPNNVGKATPKKLQAWSDYLNRKEAAMQAYLQETVNIHTQFFKRLDDSGLKYRRNGNHVVINNGCLKIECELGEQHVYYKPIEFDTSMVGIGKTLDFMFDNIITVTPRL